MKPLERAGRVMPGGVSSPVRSFRGVGGEPVFVRAAVGARLVAEDGRRYIDYICGHGAHILGHGHPNVLSAVTKALSDGITFGAPTLAEVTLAEMICSALPSVEMLRLVSSHTEAAEAALRLARAETGRHRVLLFAGCFHGSADPFLAAAGVGGLPETDSAPGVPPSVAADTLVAPYNDLEAARELFAQDPEGIAAVFVEPVAGHMSLVPPEDGFLEGLRELCDRHGALLVLDETLTGFRVSWGGAQTLLDVEPDLTLLGRVIGGGLPLAAFGGSRPLMQRIAPAGSVFQAGALAGNRLAVAAGLAVLEQLQADSGAAYRTLEETGGNLGRGIMEAAARRGVPTVLHRQGSMLGLFLTPGPVRALADVDGSDRRLFSRLFHILLEEGIHLPPSPYATLFLSTSHREEDVAATVDAFDRAFARLAAEPA